MTVSTTAYSHTKRIFYAKRVNTSFFVTFRASAQNYALRSPTEQVFLIRFIGSIRLAVPLLTIIVGVLIWATFVDNSAVRLSLSSDRRGRYSISNSNGAYSLFPGNCYA